MSIEAGLSILANRNIWRFPNIWGQVGSGFLRGGPNTDYGLGAFSYISTSEAKVASGNYFLATVFDFDASRQSSLYQSGTTEVKVNGLLGLHLIKAFWFPNIYGDLYVHFADRGTIRQTSGVFSVLGNAVDPPANGTFVVSNQAWMGARFNAANQNEVYKNTVTTVQPAGLYGLYLIRAYQWQPIQGINSDFVEIWLV